MNIRDHSASPLGSSSAFHRIGVIPRTTLRRAYLPRRRVSPTLEAVQMLRCRSMGNCRSWLATRFRRSPRGPQAVIGGSRSPGTSAQSYGMRLPLNAACSKRTALLFPLRALRYSRRTSFRPTRQARCICDASSAGSRSRSIRQGTITEIRALVREGEEDARLRHRCEDRILSLQ
jgi:hypothetical protein